MAAPPDRVDALLAAWQAELPDVLGPSAELVKRIMLLAADLEEATRRVLPGFGLTVAQFDVLVTLRRAGRPYRMKPTELSRALLLSTGGTSNVTNHLAAEGLVERRDDPDDRRGTLIQLTDRGVALAEAAVRANSAAHAALFAAVPPDVLHAATHALRDLSTTTSTNRPPPPLAAQGGRLRGTT